MININKLMLFALSLVLLAKSFSYAGEDLDLQMSYKRNFTANNNKNRSVASYEDLLFEIFKYLDFKQINKCEEVNKEFFKVAKKIYLFNAISEEIFWGITIQNLHNNDISSNEAKLLCFSFEKGRTIYNIFNNGNINLIYVLSRQSPDVSMSALKKLVDLGSVKASTTYTKGVNFINFLRGSTVDTII